MSNTINLKIDKEFKNLIRPLHQNEYLQLESNLLSDGCRDPIIVWNGTIIDGHNRYEICQKQGIPFRVMEMEFSCREEVIAWICANQLGRRNLAEATRKFLIGMQYESEKIACTKKNGLGLNQYSDETSDRLTPADRHRTAERIGRENHISHSSVEKYAAYTRALEVIGKKVPALVPNIISGRFKISHNNVIELSRRSKEEIELYYQRMEQYEESFVKFKNGRIAASEAFSPAQSNSTSSKSVKDMPQYDPDAEITGLTLTIPSWKSSIDRIRTHTKLEGISEDARVKLARTLDALNDSIQEMLSTIRGD